MTKTCVTLLSGGLDSLLVTRLMAAQGIAVIAMHSVNCFHGSQDIGEKKHRLSQTALRLGAAEVHFPDLTEEVVALTKRPQHGYGKNLNACIDCRLKTIETGFRLMRERGADFVATGEVVGQRPMSQRRDAIALADRKAAEWGFAGLLLRPLSAKLLPKTRPEEEGWVDPALLYDISGRGRERQMALAEAFDLGEYPSPAGGCLLTDPGFSRRLELLMGCNPDWTADDAELLKVGRHFQITPTVRLVASRREEENHSLRRLARPDDRLFINAERNGAVVMLRGAATPEAERMAAGLAVYYSKMREAESAEVECWREDGGHADSRRFAAAPAHPDAMREMEREVAAALPPARRQGRGRGAGDSAKKG